MPTADQEKGIAKAVLDHRDPALRYFDLTRGGGMESAPMAQARRAFLEHRFEDCFTFARQALAEQPWRYEALVVEATAWRIKAINMGHAGASVREIRSVLVNHAMPALERAQELAKSDLDIHRARIQILSLLAIQDSEGGRTTLEPFEKAEAIVAEASRIQPADAELWSLGCYNAVRGVFVRIAQGEDTRERSRRLLAQQEDAAARLRSEAPSIIQGPRTLLLWQLAEGQWRRGEDPRPALQEALTRDVAMKEEHDEILNLLARYRAQHGLDPEPQIRQALAIIDHEDRMTPGWYYYDTLRGESRLIEATWAWWTGRDPREAIQGGLALLRGAVAKKPDSAYPYFHLPQVLALEARLRMAHGQDASDCIAEALRHGRRAVAIRPDHYRSHLGLAEAQLVDGLDRARRHEDPRPSLAAAARTLADARHCNPTDWRIALTEARVALAEAEGGGDPGPALARAAKAAARGLAVKGDAPELLWAGAEAARLRWTLLGDQTAKDQAREHAGRALALCPELAPARDILAAVTRF